jgi:hypothetical protein
MNVLFMYAYIHYHLNECGRKKIGLKKLYFGTDGAYVMAETTLVCNTALSSFE